MDVAKKFANLVVELSFSSFSWRLQSQVSPDFSYVYMSYDSSKLREVFSPLSGGYLGLVHEAFRDFFLLDDKRTYKNKEEQDFFLSIDL